MTHADCAHFEPDTISPAAGLGDCAIQADTGQAYMPYWHKGKYHYHYQAVLLYPGVMACKEFKQK